MEEEQKAPVVETEAEDDKYVKLTREELDELKADANPNWRAARNTEKTLKELLKSKGVKFDESGNPVDEAKIDIDQIREEGRRAAKQEIINQKIEEILNNYSDEERPVVKTYFDKLTNGEDVNLSNVTKFFQDAERLATPDNYNPLQSAMSGSGRAPKSKSGAEDYSDSPEGGSIAGEMGLSYPKYKK